MRPAAVMAICRVRRSNRRVPIVSTSSLIWWLIAAGGTTPNEAKDYGSMYQHGFQDLDGHLREVIYMDPKFAE